MPTDDLWGLLFDEYLPFRLHSDHRNGVSVAKLAATLGLSPTFIAERIEAAQVCIEQQGRIRMPWIPSDFHSDVRQ